jgi:putative membrane protein
MARDCQWLINERYDCFLLLGRWAEAMEGENNMMHWYDGWGMMGGWWFMLLLTILLIVGIVWLVRAVGANSTTRRHSDAPPRQTPEEILQERYARGEIDRDEYEERRQGLQG